MATPSETAFVQTVAAAVRRWLAGNPEPAALVENLPALKLALAQYVNNQIAQDLELVLGALGRVNGGVNLLMLPLTTLAELIDLNLNLFQLVGGETWRVAHYQLAVAQTRFDESRGMFLSSASKDGQWFETAGNARLAQIFYDAWRRFDNQALRPIAGTVLGQVSDLFDPQAGLFERAELPGGAREQPDYLPAYAAAIQMFLTASETTERGTYISRALILADYALAHLTRESAAAPPRDRVQFIEALNWLEGFTHEPRYLAHARLMLEHVRAGIASPDAANANVALAMEHLAR